MWKKWQSFLMILTYKTKYLNKLKPVIIKTTQMLFSHSLPCQFKQKSFSISQIICSVLISLKAKLNRSFLFLHCQLNRNLVEFYLLLIIFFYQLLQVKIRWILLIDFLFHEDLPRYYQLKTSIILHSCQADNFSNPLTNPLLISNHHYLDLVFRKALLENFFPHLIQDYELWIWKSFSIV